MQQNQLDMEEKPGDTQGETGQGNSTANNDGSGEYKGNTPTTNKL